MENKDHIERHVERNVQQYVTKGFKILFFIVLGLTIAFLVGYIVMRLWNWLMPELFGLPLVSYWQAVGILILAKIFFGFGGGNGPGKHSKKKGESFSGNCRPMRKDFSKWKHYDAFWKEEGEEAYKAYLEKIKKEEL